MAKATRILQVLLVVAIAESFVHYLDNTVRWDDYTIEDPSPIGSWITQWMIPLSWVLFTIAGVVGYRRFVQGRYPQAAALLGAYSASGLISLLHYVDIDTGDLSTFQNTFVFADVALGTAMLGFAVWTALSPAGTSRPRGGDGSPTGRGPRAHRASTSPVPGTPAAPRG